MSYTLLQLRRELARNTGGLITGTATGGSTTTVIDTAVLDSGEWGDDHFNGACVYISDTTDDAAPKGEARFITDFVASTGTLTVGNPFSAAVGAGDTFDIYMVYTKDEMDTALMLAVEDWRLYTTLSVTDTAAEYALSAEGLHSGNQVSGVFIRDADDDDEEFRSISDYRVWDNGGTLTIEFGGDGIDSSLSVRVEYHARYDQLSAGGTFGAAYDDAQVVGGDLWMHILKAQSFLYRAKMNSVSGADWDRYSSLYREAVERMTVEGPENRRRAGRVQNTDDWVQGVTRRYQARDWHL